MAFRGGDIIKVAEHGVTNIGGQDRGSLQPHRRISQLSGHLLMIGTASLASADANGASHVVAPEQCAAAGDSAIANRKVVMAKAPEGQPHVSDFSVVSEGLPQIGEGEMLLRTKWLTLDPYIRGLGSNEDTKQFGGFMRDPKNQGNVIIGGTVSEVVESRANGWSPGDLVVGYYGWQEYSVGKATDVQWNHPKWPIEKWDSSLGPPSTALGILGMTGYTAYFGLLEVAKARAGETVVVSAASGAVGQVVGQLAKIHGCRVVGIAGGPKKCAFVVNELGFDACIDYKDKSVDLPTALKAAVPGGIDVYFENVGGDILEAVIPLLNKGCRIPVCGWVSQYNGATHATSPLARLNAAGLPALGGKAKSTEGYAFFSFINFVSRFPEALQAMSTWMKEGKLKYRESVTVGLDGAAGAFMGMLRGENFGKTIVQVSA